MNNRTKDLLSKILVRGGRQNRIALSRAVTLLESTLPSDIGQAKYLLDALVQERSKVNDNGFSIGIAVGLHRDGVVTYFQ